LCFKLNGSALALIMMHSQASHSILGDIVDFDTASSTIARIVNILDFAVFLFHGLLHIKVQLSLCLDLCLSFHVSDDASVHCLICCQY
jgi:hypothetical protein